MEPEQFAAASKNSKSLLAPLERRFPSAVRYARLRRALEQARRLRTVIFALTAYIRPHYNPLVRSRTFESRFLCAADINP
jgi:hypothetical protein